MYNVPLLTRLGDALRFYRQKQGLSQEKLAELADLHRTYVGGLECGERNPSVLSLQKLLHALKVTWSEFSQRLDG